MNIIKDIKILLLKENMNQTEIANKIGTTQANLSKKFKNNTLYSKDIEKIADALGYDLKLEFIKKNKQIWDS